MRIADRDYQIASKYFYLENYDTAILHYKQIVKNPDSPYNKLAAYMVARSLLDKRDYDACPQVNIIQQQFVE